MISLRALKYKQIAINTSSTNKKAALLVAFIAGIAGMGDAFLYAYLPVHGKEIGLSLFAVGFILSINRFSRLFTNNWVAWVSNKFGLKKILFISVFITIISSFFYGQNLILLYWFILRVIWGVAFSAFRLSYMRYSQLSQNPTSSLGLGKSLQEIGALLVYWFGPFCLYLLGPELLFTSLAILSILLLPLVMLLPTDSVGNQNLSLFKLSKPKKIDFWAFLLAFVESAIIIGLSKLLNFSEDSVISVLGGVAVYISLKKLLSIVISPFVGRMSSKVGINKLFQYSAIGIFLSVLLIVLNISSTGIIIFFFFLNVNLVCLPLIAIQNTEENGIYRRLSYTNTARDLGLSIGALIVLPLLDVVNASIFFFITLLFMILSYLKLIDSSKFKNML